MADDPGARRRHQLGLEQARAAGSELRLHEYGDVDRVHVRLAAIHGAAGLRRARADSRLVPRGIGRSRRERLEDTALGDPAARVARPRRWFDLHVCADARRLHHTAARRRNELAVHRQHRLQLHARGKHTVRRCVRDDPDGDRRRLSAARKAPRRLRGTMTGRGARISFAVWSALVIAFLWIPLVLIALYAFNGSSIQGWPITSWTVHWFSIAWHNQDARDAFRLSVEVALIATAI